MGGLLVAALIWLVVAIVLEQRLKARLRRLTPAAADLPSAMGLLFDEPWASPQRAGLCLERAPQAPAAQVARSRLS